MSPLDPGFNWDRSLVPYSNAITQPTRCSASALDSVDIQSMPTLNYKRRIGNMPPSPIQSTGWQGVECENRAVSGQSLGWLSMEWGGGWDLVRAWPGLCSLEDFQRLALRARPWLKSNWTMQFASLGKKDP